MTRSADLPFVIKVCGITNEEDARIAVEAGANALGFNLYEKTPRHLTAERAGEIIEAVSGEYLRVAILVNPGAQRMPAAHFDVIQLHGKHCPLLPERRVWRAVTPSEIELSYPAEAYLFDTPTEKFGGSGEVFDWRLAAERSCRVIIAGGLDSSNVADAIATALPWGVDACSRLESRPGKKDARKVVAFITAAREAFRIYMQQETSL